MSLSIRGSVILCCLGVAILLAGVIVMVSSTLDSVARASASHVLATQQETHLLRMHGRLEAALPSPDEHSAKVRAQLDALETVPGSYRDEIEAAYDAVARGAARVLELAAARNGFYSSAQELFGPWLLQLSAVDRSLRSVEYAEDYLDLVSEIRGKTQSYRNGLVKLRALEEGDEAEQTGLALTKTQEEIAALTTAIVKGDEELEIDAIEDETASRTLEKLRSILSELDDSTGRYRAARAELQEARAALDRDTDRVIALLTEAAAECEAESESARTQANIGLLVAAAISLAVLGAIFWVLSRRVLEPLSRVSSLLENISQGDGDLTRRLEVRSADEVGRLSSAFNRFVESIQAIIRQLASVTGNLTGAANDLNEVAGSMTQAAHRTNDQAVVLTQRSLRVSESVQASAEKVSLVQEAVRQGTASSSRAQEVMETASRAMREANEHVVSLRDRTGQISGVASVIGSVADQTNLLALNATIEASRAGDAGKGFAVVANEVKALAGSTSQATEEIAEKIRLVVTESEQVEAALQAIGAVIDQVGEIQTTSSEAAQTNALAAGEILELVTRANDETEQIRSGAHEVESSTADTSAASERTVRSADAVREIASAIQSLVENFKC